MNIPIYHKLCLTVEEAAEYSGIGENKLRKIIEEDKTLDWVLFVGNRTKVKRTLFEKWVLAQSFL